MRKKKKLTAICAALMAIMLALPILPASTAKAYDKDSFDAEIEAGYGGNVKLGMYAPFKITVTNNDKDFAGYIQLIVPGFEGENNMYQTMVNIPSGESSTIVFSAPVENNLGCVEIRVADKKGKELWSEQKLTNVMRNADIINVGVFTDDFAALGYMDKAPLFSNSQMKTSIFELDEHDLTNDWHSLEMLDIIVISDFSTDLFTDKQVGALELWVQNGGLLMVGTGSTSSKTLSGINNVLFTTNNGVMRSYSTMLGINDIDFQALYYQQSSNTYYWWDQDTEYKEWLSDNFDDYRSEFAKNYGDDFCDMYGIDKENEYDPLTGSLPENSDVYDVQGDQDYIDFMIENAEQTYDPWYKEYVAEQFYETWTQTIKNTLNAQSVISAEELGYIRVDCLGIDLEDADMSVPGDIEGGGTYDLCQVKREGSGFICLAAIDFTKNPIPSYKGSSYAFIAIIDTVYGRTLTDKANKYQDAVQYGNAMSQSYGDYVSDVITANSGAPLPPIAIYLLIIWGYVVALIVLYSVMKKKKKSFNLWFIYPAVAVGVGLLVFCIGFSSRITRPVVNNAVMITLEDGKMYENQYAAIITPSRREYNIGFSGDYTIAKIVEKKPYYYGTWNTDPVDISTYTYIHTIKPDGVETSFKLNPLEGSGMFLSKMEKTDKDISFVDGVLTNNTGVTLEHAILVKGSDLSGKGYNTGIRLYDVNSLAPGATFDISTNSKYEMLPTHYDLASASDDIPSYNTITPVIGGLLLGSRSSSYQKYAARKVLFELVEDSIEYNRGDYIFIGFPKEDISGDAVTSKRFQENKNEVIVKVFKAGEY